LTPWNLKLFSNLVDLYHGKYNFNSDDVKCVVIVIAILIVKTEKQNKHEVNVLDIFFKDNSVNFAISWLYISFSFKICIFFLIWFSVISPVSSTNYFNCFILKSCIVFHKFFVGVSSDSNTT